MRISDWSSDVCSSDLRLDVEILVEWDRCGHAHAPVRTGAASWPNREPAATLRRGIAAMLLQLSCPDLIRAPRGRGLSASPWVAGACPWARPEGRARQ